MATNAVNTHAGYMSGLSLDSLLQWVNITYLVALAVTVIASGALWRLSVLSGAAKDRQLAMYQSDARVQIAKAQETARDATKAAADANERAAGLEKQSLELQKQVAEAQKAAAEAEAEQQRLKSLVVWRALDQQRAGQLTSAIAGSKGSVLIEYPFGDPEALLLAVTLQNCFGNAGWELRTVAVAFQDILPLNIQITGTNSALAQRVGAALSTVGLSWSGIDATALGVLDRNTIQKFGAWGPAEVRIIVGSRPVSDQR
jgi:hypothetical protein